MCKDPSKRFIPIDPLHNTYISGAPHIPYTVMGRNKVEHILCRNMAILTI